MSELQVSGISRQYPTPRGTLQILDAISFTMSAGDAAAITGPSGSGKSSLLYILGGLESPSSGTVTLDDTDIYSLDASRRAAFRNAEIGFVFQDHCLLPQCTVLENVLVPTLVATGESNFEDRARDLIDQVGLGDRLEHRPGELSGGEKQRVAIARALVRNPRLLLCDEPTGNLDADSAGNVASILFDLHAIQSNILIAVTHSPALASAFPMRFELNERKLHQAVS